MDPRDQAQVENDIEQGPLLDHEGSSSAHSAEVPAPPAPPPVAALGANFLPRFNIASLFTTPLAHSYHKPTTACLINLPKDDLQVTINDKNFVLTGVVDCEARATLEIFLFAEVDDSGNCCNPLQKRKFRFEPALLQPFEWSITLEQPLDFLNGNEQLTPLLFSLRIASSDQADGIIGLTTWAVLVGEVLRVTRRLLHYSDGRTAVLSEVFGGDQGQDDCVVCLSELADTIIAPCGHLCVCNSCAISARQSLPKCPLCRTPMEALIKADVPAGKPRTSSHEATEEELP